MNEQVVADRLAMAMMGERVAWSLVAKKLNYGIIDRNLEDAVGDIMESLTGKIKASVSLELNVYGKHHPQTFEHPAEYPDIEVYTEDETVENPRPIPLEKFLFFVIKNLRKTQRSVNITPEQMMADRQMMKVVLMTMEQFRELDDVLVNVEISGTGHGSTDDEVTLVQKGRFVRSGKVVLDYELPESSMDAIIGRIEENAEEYLPEPDYPEEERDWD